MILLCAGQRSEKAFDALLLFAALLDQLGHAVAIDARFMSETCQKHQKYEAVPYLTDHKEISPSAVIVLAGDGVSEEGQLLLRGLQLADEQSVTLLGRFDSYQDELTAANRVAYACGAAPQVVNIADFQPVQMLEGTHSPLVTSLAAEPPHPADAPARVMIYLDHDYLDADASLLPILGVLDHVAGVELHIITNGRGKDLIRKSSFGSLSVFGYGELPPSTLAGLTDIAVFFGNNVPGERMAVFALALLSAGKVVVDCTQTQAFVAVGAPVISGHPDLHALQNHLTTTVLENRTEIGRRALQSDWLKGFDSTALEQRLDLPKVDAKREPGAPHTVFFPTNGNGLGHAQRCALVAEAMETDTKPVFAAFPSCVGLLQSRGFACMPMVSRSSDHNDEYANDLVNHLRLLSVLKAGDQLVFDGGYVFDSVYRAIAQLRLPAVWIRRGLWQPNQVHPTALERERVFSSVIVPAEAFPELNADYSFGEKLHHVGPIVATGDGPATKASLRKKLAKRFDRKVDTLVVSMLGGGIASERSTQIQMISNMMERRANCLHLVVAWPNAVIDNGLYGWKNTEVVSTKNARALAQAADLVITAAGYNSFHEMMYGRIPAIFIPQHAPYLDNQERRARAAAERDVASLVMEDELLLLEREINAFLDDGKAETVRQNLSDLTLPGSGNAAAAEVILSGQAQ